MSKSLNGVILNSHGSRLLGRLWLAGEAGRRPTVLLLHGIPGVEQQADLAYALREAGWNCLLFHYRGNWGSQGGYTLAGVLDDISAAVDYLAGHPRVDPERLACVGLSIGGWAAIQAGARDPRLRAIAALNPLVDPRRQPEDAGIFAEFASMITGLSPEALQAQWLALPAADLAAPRLAGRPVLLLTGDADALFSSSHARRLAEAIPFARWQRIPEADHIFSEHRPQVVRTVIEWLAESLLPLPPLPEGFDLRQPVEADHARVTDVLSDWWGGRDLAHLLPRLFFQHFTDTSFIVESGGELVAFLIGFISAAEPGVAYIHFVGVHPRRRQLHLGQALYGRFFRLARARGAREVHAVTAPVNAGSQAFHARLGFEITGPARDYDGPGDDRMLMRKIL